MSIGVVIESVRLVFLSFMGASTPLFIFNGGEVTRKVTESVII
jgi:hypothetical protein